VGGILAIWATLFALKTSNLEAVENPSSRKVSWVLLKESSLRDDASANRQLGTSPSMPVVSRLTISKPFWTAEHRGGSAWLIFAVPRDPFSSAFPDNSRSLSELSLETSVKKSTAVQSRRKPAEWMCTEGRKVSKWGKENTATAERL